MNVRDWWRDDPIGLKAIPWMLGFVVVSVLRAPFAVVRWAWRAVRP